MAITITIGTLTIRPSLSWSDDGLESYTGSSVNAPCTMNIPITIGGTTDEGDPITSMDGVALLLNPALFVTATSPVAYPQTWIGWAGIMSSSANVDMYMEGGGSNDTANENLFAQIIPTGDLTALVRLHFRPTFDLGGPIAAAHALQNVDRLLKTQPFSAVDPSPNAIPPNLGNTVYSTGRTGIRVYLRAELAGASGTRANAFLVFRSRWWNSGLNRNSAPEIGNPTVVIRRFSDGAEINELSAYEDQYIAFTWPAMPGPWRPVTDAALTQIELLRVDIEHNTGQNWVDQYNSSTLGTYSVYPVGPNWACSISIPAASVQDRARYRLAIIVPVTDEVGAPSEGDVKLTNSFITQELSATALPPLLPLSITGKIFNYDSDPGSDNVIATVVDHLRARITIDPSTYNAASALLPWGQGFAQELRRVRVECFFEATGVVVWDREWLRVGGVWQSNVYGDTANNLVETSAGGLISLELEVAMMFRNNAGLPDFGNKVVGLRWTVETAQNTPSEETVTRYLYAQRITVQDFRDFEEAIRSLSLYDYATGAPLVSLCGVDRVLVRVRLQAEFVTPGDTWALRAYWNTEQYGYPGPTWLRPVSGAREHDSSDSATGMVRLSHPSISAMPETFDLATMEALFHFDPEAIPMGAKARLYVIAQRIPE